MAASAPRFSISTRQQLVDWAYSLLPDPFACPRDVGATYRMDARELEWASRPLWAVFSLLAGGERPDDPRLAPFIERMRAGLTPGRELAFPEPTRANRQVVFEQVVYGYGLLCLGKELLDLLDPAQQERLAAWLNAANDVELPWGGWYTARILVNAGLKRCGLAYDEERFRADCAAVEGMYAGDGWYEDGTPFRRDLHIASLFHFTSLLLERYMDENPIADTAARAIAFEDDYAYWFDSQGRCIPFGRSLTYRFGNAAFWSALVLAGCSDKPVAQIKGMLLNHLSWWHDALAGQERPLAPGYGYAGAPVMEDYAGPGTSYWACKAFTVLALPASDPFWAVDPQLPKLEPRRIETQPGMLIQVGERHSYALSAMQYPDMATMQRMSKYGKLCYSTAFGWNASRDAAGLSSFAIDGALALSVAGTGQFASRSRIQAFEVRGGYVYSAWSYGSIAQVESWLIPVDELRHVRAHRVQSLYPLESYEGGFPLWGWRSKFDSVRKEPGSVVLRRAKTADGPGERGMVSGITDALAARAEIEEAFRVAGLERVVAELGGAWVQREASMVGQSPNSNIYSCEPSAVPALKLAEPMESFCVGCVVYGDPGQD